MRIISQYRNNQLFEVVRVVYNNGELIPCAQYCDQECLQVHTVCEHAFHCRWRFQRSIRGLSDEGSAYTCPKCGKRLWKGTYDTPWLDLSESGRKRVLVPYRIELEAKEYKNYLDICAETLNVDIESPIDVSVHTVKKYTLRFDFKSREAVYIEHGARGRVLSDKVRIVAAFKNRKPVICIEIRNGAVAQAKLVNNQPIREDAELNRALISWAKSRRLTIETNDVQTEREVAGVAAAV